MGFATLYPSYALDHPLSLSRVVTLNMTLHRPR